MQDPESYMNIFELRLIFYGQCGASRVSTILCLRGSLGCCLLDRGATVLWSLCVHECLIGHLDLHVMSAQCFHFHAGSYNIHLCGSTLCYNGTYRS
jgi:hypothetical protein